MWKLYKIGITGSEKIHCSRAVISDRESDMGLLKRWNPAGRKEERKQGKEGGRAEGVSKLLSVSPLVDGELGFNLEPMCFRVSFLTC